MRVYVGSGSKALLILNLGTGLVSGEITLRAFYSWAEISPRRHQNCFETSGELEYLRVFTGSRTLGVHFATRTYATDDPIEDCLIRVEGHSLMEVCMGPGRAL
jgi:hypothetical protein